MTLTDSPCPVHRQILLVPASKYMLNIFLRLPCSEHPPPTLPWCPTAHCQNDSTGSPVKTKQITSLLCSRLLSGFSSRRQKTKAQTGPVPVSSHSLSFLSLLQPHGTPCCSPTRLTCLCFILAVPPAWFALSGTTFSLLSFKALLDEPLLNETKTHKQSGQGKAQVGRLK